MKTFHLVCNAHIDPIWQWDWQEGASAVLSTFQSAVNLAKNHNYIFCHNEVSVYKYVEEYAPELFSEIQQLVKAKKWHIMGGWYLQPDCNIPKGESIVRQISEGKRYFKEKFGVYPTTAINFDPFGHTQGLVQIIKKCGQDSYIFMRPYAHQLKLPSEQFIWRGLDGSQIKATRACSYNTPLGRSRDVIEGRAEAESENVGLILWGVGNHGGGPSDKDLTDIEDLMKSSKDKYIHSTPEEFFNSVNPENVFDSSLRISMPGCYTSMYKIKQKHAILENELYFTEKILSTAFLKGLLKEYPEKEIHSVTEDLLNAEFHDVLPGTSVKCGEDNGLKLLEHGLLDIERLKTKAFFALTTEESPAKDGEYPILVFNPHPYTYAENVECEFMLADQNWNDDIYSVLSVVDESGIKVPYQIIKEESNLNLDWRKRIIFKAELSPLSLKRFSVFVDFKEKENKEIHQNLVYSDNRRYVEIDSKTGLLKSFKIDNTELIKNGFSLTAFKDNADPWAMADSQLSRLGTDEEAFSLSAKPYGVFKNMKSIQVIEDGEIFLAIEAFFEHNSTKAVIKYKIYKNEDYIDVDVTLFLGDIDEIIKLKLPVSFEGELVGQTAFGTEKLFTDARENVSQAFTAFSKNGKSLAILKNGCYGSHYENGSLYLSLVRGVTYCAHPINSRPLLPTDRFTKKIDQGENNFSFRLIFTDTDKLERKALEYCEKPYALNIFPIPSKIKGTPFKINLSDDTITLVTLKKADGEKDKFILRLFNNTDSAKTTDLTINDAKISLTFTKFEVKTIIYENNRFKEAKELLI